MRSLLKRPTIALLLALLWISWALWANVPHYYDAQAMKTEIAAALGSENVNLQPAAAGFPFTYMRYDYSNSDQLTIHDTELSALLPDALFSLAGALGIALLVARTRHISFLGIALLCCLLCPAALMHVRLNGLHPAVISYLYLLPLIMLMIALAVETIRDRKRQNQAMHSSREAARFDDGQSSAATG